MNEDFLRLRQVLSAHYAEGEARSIAFLVFDEAFGISRTDIYADKVRQFSLDERQQYVNICQRLQQGEPVQYVLGSADFCGHRFGVAPGVLIPRPETEELVAWAVDEVTRLRAELPAGTVLRVLDAGTGSGCIAVSLKLACPDVEVEAWDLSAEALHIASENARCLGAEVHFAQHDLLMPWPAEAAFHLVVSNPPYICQRERAEMEAHVLLHEPDSALFVPDADPLLFYRALARSAAGGVLLPGGALLVEINRAYGAETARLFADEGLLRTEVRLDAFGNDRMVGGYLNQ